VAASGRIARLHRTTATQNIPVSTHHQRRQRLVATQPTLTFYCGFLSKPVNCEDPKYPVLQVFREIVPDDRSRDVEALLAEFRGCRQHSQVTAERRPARPVRRREVDKTKTDITSLRVTEFNRLVKLY